MPMLHSKMFRFLIYLIVCLIPVLSNASQVDNRSYPIQVDGLVLKEYRAGACQREIAATHAVFSQEKNQVQLIQPQFVVFDQQGKTKLSLTCDSSQIHLQQKLVEIVGNVQLKLQDGVQLRTDYLIWDTSQKKFSTDATVQIIKDAHTVQGRGLESDENFTQIQIQHFMAKGNKK